MQEVASFWDELEAHKFGFDFPAAVVKTYSHFGGDVDKDEDCCFWVEFASLTLV